MNSHKITKIIRKNSTDYLCENHNNTTVSYPTKQSLKEDHPNLDESTIIIFDKKKIQESIEFRLEQAQINDKSHTQILMENI